MRIVIVGNCQARPLADIFESVFSDTVSVQCIIVHLANETLKQEHLETLDGADLIFSQYVQPGYPATYLVTEFLKEKYKSNILVFPNLFFRGQNPDLVYLTEIFHENSGEKTRRRVRTLYEDYCSRVLFESWREGKSVEDAVSIFSDENRNAERFSGFAKESLDELENRELICDVKSSSYIDENWRSKRLFFTFNHPSIELLFHVFSELCLLSGLKLTDKIPLEYFAEPLGNIMPIDPPGYLQSVGASFKGIETGYFRKGYNFKNSGRLFSITDVANDFFQTLEAYSPDDSRTSFRLS